MIGITVPDVKEKKMIVKTILVKDKTCENTLLIPFPFCYHSRTVPILTKNREKEGYSTEQKL